MRREVVLQLAEALDSDQYKDRQCKTVLSVGEGDERQWDVCGVLCELSIVEGIITPPTLDKSSKRWEYAGHFHDIPLAVQAWAKYEGPRDRFVVARLGSEPRGLPGLNDSGATFPELAEALRAYAAA